MKFTHAIVRPPGPGFADGITTAGLGAPKLSLALEQHAAYCHALRACGVDVLHLDPDPDFPDSTFVEDTAVLWQGAAVMCHPGAEARRGEVERMIGPLRRYFDVVHRIDAGTLDGGDVCLDNGRLLVGLSDRTSEAGAQQLADFLGMSLETIDIRARGLLHLKSGLAGLGEHWLAVDGLVADHLPIAAEDQYAANAIRVNDRVIIAAGFPRVKRRIEMMRLPVLEVEMSEFQKMDGGPSCLSLRF